MVHLHLLLRLWDSEGADSVPDIQDTVPAINISYFEDKWAQVAQKYLDIDFSFFPSFQLKLRQWNYSLEIFGNKEAGVHFYILYIVLMQLSVHVVYYYIWLFYWAIAWTFHYTTWLASCQKSDAMLVQYVLKLSLLHFPPHTCQERHFFLFYNGALHIAAAADS